MSDLRIQPGARQGLYENNRKSASVERGFVDVIKQAVKKTNDMEIQADQSVEKMLRGEAGIHETMVAIQKSDISLRLLLQVRNKVLEAYREIMRMQF